MRAEVYRHLQSIKERIAASQFEDGHWPSNWPDGAAAVARPIDEVLYKKVIATGHHLEWQSIAPPDLLLPEEQIKKAMDWVVKTTKERTKAEITPNFTFFSHVGAALCNWRQVRAADFWRNWEKDHPYDPSQEPVEPAAAPAATTPVPAADAAH
jgi:hypothetical protein